MSEFIKYYDRQFPETLNLSSREHFNNIIFLLKATQNIQDFEKVVRHFELYENLTPRNLKGIDQKDLDNLWYDLFCSVDFFLQNSPITTVATTLNNCKTS